MRSHFWIIVVLLCRCLTNEIFAQEPIGAIELPEMNILYRGYPNKVVFAVTNNGDRNIIVNAVNCTVEEPVNGGYTIARPGGGKTAILSLILTDGEQYDTIKRVHYRVSNLPDPILYWGGSKSNSKATLHSTSLFAKYPPEVPLNASFSIAEWSIFDKGDTISGVGNNLESADSLFRSFEVPTVVTIQTVVVGPDGIRRKILGNWSVDAWTDPQQEPKVIRCG